MRNTGPMNKLADGSVELLYAVLPQEAPAFGCVLNSTLSRTAVPGTGRREFDATCVLSAET